MRWQKHGIIYQPAFDNSWRDNSALTPTPLLLNEDTIRVYASFRDSNGVGRIGYIDLDADNPSQIKKISHQPVLDIGRNGCFDDNGVILGDLVKVNNEWHMYYVGFQLANKVKFLAFTGLAISSDGGETFSRYSEAPILDRTHTALYIRAIHTVIYENNKFKVWCGVGAHWELINDAPYPSYNIRYYESDDGIHFNEKDTICIDFEGSEYRIGRPRVFKDKDKYKMIFTFGTLEGRYEMGYAESDDGIHWQRDDAKLGITLSTKGWDSEWIAYGVPLRYRDKTYLFYNGNAMGKDGFGYAELVGMES